MVAHAAESPPAKAKARRHMRTSNRSANQDKTKGPKTLYDI
jgi:hypothetical protein